MAALQNNIRLILDVTNEGDCSRGVKPYYPTQLGQASRNGHIPITHKNFVRTKDNPQIANSEYLVKDKDDKKTIRHRIHYQGLLDYGSATPAVSIMEPAKQFSHDAIIAHCRAGVGRTGTLVVSTALDKMISRREVTPRNYRPMIDALILTGRIQRGTQSVQNPGQYESILRFAEQRMNR